MGDGGGWVTKRILCSPNRPDELLELKEVHSVLGELTRRSTLFTAKHQKVLELWYSNRQFEEIAAIIGIPQRKVVPLFSEALQLVSMWSRLFREYRGSAGGYANKGRVYP